ncbi:Gfo/Idh/MocA family oxidoreductase [Nocardia paucivorans]|uniref:Gfo/Idh/MocA family oxidoreductase n=1 Tax=Nocardia paucivorans TaxID=114259 RepID=UPI001FE070D0|nr:Gfo/Idh/MocA family oxidoreductase [Nocardia paucivorans]
MTTLRADGKPTAVVVGGTFGAVYAEALTTPDSPVELVGVLGTGAGPARDLAHRLGLPLYTDPGALGPVDIALVVVRSGVVGGAGARISAELLDLGIHVLQEQPVHADEIVELLGVAARRGVRYGVNDFYGALTPVRRFVTAARALAARTPVRYVQARSAIQVAYPLFTVLADLVPALTPAKVEVLPTVAGAFATGRIILGDVPVDLLIDNQLCASDPDNYVRLMHEVTVGTDAGELVLTHTHGCTHWRRRQMGVGIDRPIVETVGAADEPTTSDIRERIWPDGVRRAVADFLDTIEAGRSPVSHRFIRAVRLWSQFTAAVGPAALIEPIEMPQITAEELLTS